MYKKSFYGYGKENVQEAIGSIDQKFEIELKEAEEEIEEAVKEHKTLYEKLNSAIAEYKRLRESTGQLKQLKEYMPYIVSQKKISFDKETAEIRKDTEEYIHSLARHSQIIDEEIEKVQQKIELFVNSLSQLYILRDVKEFDDIIRHFDQVLEDYRPRRSEMVSQNESRLNAEYAEEELDSIEQFLAADSEEQDIIEDNEELDNSEDDDEQLFEIGTGGIKIAAEGEKASLAGGVVRPEHKDNDEFINDSIIEEVENPKIAASVTGTKRNNGNDNIVSKNTVNFSVQDSDEFNELNELLKQFM